MTSFFRFVSVPILIGLAQMVTLCVGQLNLAVGRSAASPRASPA